MVTCVAPIPGFYFILPCKSAAGSVSAHKDHFLLIANVFYWESFHCTIFSFSSLFIFVFSFIVITMLNCSCQLLVISVNSMLQSYTPLVSKRGTSSDFFQGRSKFPRYDIPYSNQSHCATRSAYNLISEYTKKINKSKSIPRRPI